MITVDSVTKYYFGEPVLKDVSLEVCEGNNLGLIGPGGAGKSLLSKIIVGLVEPDEGRVYVEGQEVTSMSKIELAKMRAKFGMLFQNYALFDFMDVGENIAFPLRQDAELSDEEIQEKVLGLLEMVDLPGVENLQINELSGGMKKRVTFARAIVRNPPYLIYDDPSAGLDPVTTSKIFILLKQLKQRHGITSITISHELLPMREVCDQWAMLRAGELVFHGSLEEIERSPDPFVQEFWQGGTVIP